MKAIATPKGEPTKLIDLTPKEIEARNAEIELAEAKEIEEAPYKRIAEIDAELTEKAPRMLEDLFRGKELHESVVALIEEKEEIRKGL